jgi:hypothetical protein
MARVTDITPTRHPGRYGAWIPGVALIGLGIVFLIQNYLGREIHNWWALFILIPVFFTLEHASLQAGRSAEAVGQLWPIFLIIGGLSLLVSRSWRA